MLAALPYRAPEHSAAATSTVPSSTADSSASTGTRTPPLTSAQDIWAFGCLLYELTFGFSPVDPASSWEPPFVPKDAVAVVHESANAALHQVRAGETVLLPQLPRPLRGAGKGRPGSASGEGGRSHSSTATHSASLHDRSPTLALQHLLSRCLQADPSRRANVTELCAHPFFMVSAEERGDVVAAATIAPNPPSALPLQPAWQVCVSACQSLGLGASGGQPSLGAASASAGSPLRPPANVGITPAKVHSSQGAIGPPGPSSNTSSGSPSPQIKRPTSLPSDASLHSEQEADTVGCAVSASAPRPAATEAPPAPAQQTPQSREEETGGEARMSMEPDATQALAHAEALHSCAPPSLPSVPRAHSTSQEDSASFASVPSLPALPSTPHDRGNTICVNVRVPDMVAETLASIFPPNDFPVAPVVGSTAVDASVDAVFPAPHPLSLVGLFGMLKRGSPDSISVAGAPRMLLCERHTQGHAWVWAPPLQHLPVPQSMAACRDAAQTREVMDQLLSADTSTGLQCAGLALAACAACQYSPRLAYAVLEGPLGVTLLQWVRAAKDPLATTAAVALASALRHAEAIPAHLWVPCHAGVAEGSPPSAWEVCLERTRPSAAVGSPGLAVACSFILAEAGFYAAAAPGGNSLRPPAALWETLHTLALGQGEWPGSHVAMLAAVQTLANIAAVAPTPSIPCAGQVQLPPSHVSSTAGAVACEEFMPKEYSSPAELDHSLLLAGGPPVVLRASTFWVFSAGLQQAHHMTDVLPQHQTALLQSCAGGIGQILRAQPTLAVASYEERGGTPAWLSWIDWQVIASRLGAAAAQIGSTKSTRTKQQDLLRMDSPGVPPHQASVQADAASTLLRLATLVAVGQGVCPSGNPVPASLSSATVSLAELGSQLTLAAFNGHPTWRGKEGAAEAVFAGHAVSLTHSAQAPHVVRQGELPVALLGTALRAVRYSTERGFAGVPPVLIAAAAPLALLAPSLPSALARLEPGPSPEASSSWAALLEFVGGDDWARACQTAWVSYAAKAVETPASAVERSWLPGLSGACARMAQLVSSIAAAQQWEEFAADASLLALELRAVAAVLDGEAKLLRVVEHALTFSPSRVAAETLDIVQGLIAHCNTLLLLRPSTLTSHGTLLEGLCRALAAAGRITSTLVTGLAGSGEQTHEEEALVSCFHDVCVVLAETGGWLDAAEQSATSSTIQQSIVQDMLPAATALSATRPPSSATAKVLQFCIMQLVSWRAASTAPVLVAAGGLSPVVACLRAACHSQEHGSSDVGFLSDSIQLLHTLLFTGEADVLIVWERHGLESVVRNAFLEVLGSLAGRSEPLARDARGSSTSLASPTGGTGEEDSLHSLHFLLLLLTDAVYEVTANHDSLEESSQRILALLQETVPSLFHFMSWGLDTLALSPAHRGKALGSVEDEVATSAARLLVLAAKSTATREAVTAAMCEWQGAARDLAAVAAAVRGSGTGIRKSPVGVVAHVFECAATSAASTGAATTQRLLRVLHLLLRDPQHSSDLKSAMSRCTPLRACLAKLASSSPDFDHAGHILTALD